MSTKATHTFNVNPELNKLSERVIGAAIEVHKHLGAGYLESVYEAALCVELSLLGIKFERQKEIPLTYKGVDVGGGRIDLLIEGVLIVELKAVDILMPVHQAQVISYLKATKCELGLLLNFNAKLLKEGIVRVARTQSSP